MISQGAIFAFKDDLNWPKIGIIPIRAVCLYGGFVVEMAVDVRVDV